MDLHTIISFLLSLLCQAFGVWLISQLIFSLLRQTKIWNPRRLPPGPFPLPIFGNLHCLGKAPHKSLAQIARQYGDLVTLQLGSLTTIVISSPSRAREVFREHDLVLAHRQIRQSTTAVNQHLHSVVFIPPDGHMWRYLRKIGTFNLFSNSRLDAGRDVRRKKVQELISYAQECSSTSTSVNISQAAFSTSLNILSNTIFSIDLAELSSGDGANVGHELKGLISDAIALGGIPNIADLFPVFSSIDPQGIYKRSKTLKQRILDVINEIVKERMCSKNQSGISGASGDGDGDVLDVLISIHEENANFGLGDLRFFLFDLFVAGTDTTSSTIEWAMSELLRNPEKMRKAQEELDHVIGRGNLIEDHDVTNLPYLRAIIKETLRLHPAAPFLIPRKASAEVKLSGGFVIPKNAQVWINVWSMGRDEKVWKMAESFQPERFLGMMSEIDYRGQNYDLIPFGSGRRVCLGLPFAHRVLHLMLGSLISCYDWKLPEKEGGIIDMSERFGVTLQKAQPLCIIPIRCFGGNKVSTN